MEIHTLWPLSQRELEYSQGSLIDKAFEMKEPLIFTVLLSLSLLMGSSPQIIS